MFMLLSLLFPLAATPVVALPVQEPIRSRAARVAIECIFGSTCAVGELSGDRRYSAADVIAALQIAPIDPRNYVRLAIDGDPSVSGVFDPSLAFPLDDEDGWMTYSGVDYFMQDGVLVRDVTTRLASSSDGGLSWQMRATLNPPTPMTVTAGNTALCGQARCEGRMISEVPFLLDDVADPDAQRRFKLFAHRYFVYPPAADRGQDLQRALGSINLRTAPSPDGPWSDDVALLGWNLTPPEIDAAINVNLLGPVMATCAAISEGGARSVRWRAGLRFHLSVSRRRGGPRTHRSASLSGPGRLVQLRCHAARRQRCGVHRRRCL